MVDCSGGNHEAGAKKLENILAVWFAIDAEGRSAAR